MLNFNEPTEEQLKFAETIKEGIEAVDKAIGDILLRAADVFPSTHYAVFIVAEAKKFANIYEELAKNLTPDEIKSIELGADIFVSMTRKFDNPEERAATLLDHIRRVDELAENKIRRNGNV